MRRGICIFICLAILVCTMPHAAAQEKGRIALTFDDGPNGAVTERILDVLKEQNVPATFFVCGEQAEKYPGLLCRMVTEGHEIGLHSYCHCYMDTMSEDEIFSDLADCFCAVSEGCGIRPRLFRPPGGRCSETLQRCAAAERLSVILWSVDTLDWNKQECKRSFDRIRRQVGDGQIILMHDLLKTSCEIAEKAIVYLKQSGYTFCTVSELFDNSLEYGQIYHAVDGKRNFS